MVSSSGTVTDVPHEVCTGCAACAASCPAVCISMRPDAEGFVHPIVDNARCTTCGKCFRICPAVHRPDAREPLAVYAARSNDDVLRLESSSGGVFTLLARQTLSTGGVVFGAGWSDDLHVVHKAAENEEQLAELRGSKYVQSEVGHTYQEAKAQLERGRKVLYSGTPCHIAGLKAFLQRDYPNLLCVDLICHAVPSPKVFALYKRELEAKYGAQAARISFRSKESGWKRFSLVFSFENGKSNRETLGVDPFLRGFLQELYNRPSCHQCRFRELRSGADITLADYWGVRQRFPEMDDDRGVSMVLVNTPAGQIAYSALAPQIDSRESDFGDARRCNPALFRSSHMHPKRVRFFKNISSGSLVVLITKSLKPGLYRSVRVYAGRCYRKLTSLLRE